MSAATAPGCDDVDGVTAFGFDHRRARSLRHELLRGRRDHPIIGRHQIPTGLRLPRSLADLALECLDAPRDLGIGHEVGQVSGNVRRERCGELLAIKEEEPVLRRKNRRHRRTGWRIGDEGSDRFPLVRRERRDVDEPSDLRIVAGLRDYHAAVRVTHEDHWARLRRDHTLGDGDIVVERDRWMLDDADAVPMLPQAVVHALPTGTVHEPTVDEHDRDGRGVEALITLSSLCRSPRVGSGEE
jgi:hypothetical protein